MYNIALFASGAGSNAAKIIEHFYSHSFVKVSLIGCNKPQAGVLNIAKENNIPFFIIEKEPFFRGDAYVTFLQQQKIDYIILAGFLWKVPAMLVKHYPNKIINIHPALLPKFGGKGMYGHYVHQAVIDNKEKESGITIHLVDEEYDHGKHLFQASCIIDENDTADTLATKIHELEHAHFPNVIERYIIESTK